MCESLSKYVNKVAETVKTVKQSQILSAVLLRINEDVGTTCALHLPIKDLLG
jgi:hypothetical protein